MDGLSIEASSIEKVIADLKTTSRELGKAQRRGNKVVAEFTSDKARSKARSGTRMEAHFAEAIRPSATATFARILVAGRAGQMRGAFGTFYGSKQFRQFRQWVGTNWTYGAAGQGPYVLNDTVAEQDERIGDLYAKSYGDAFAETFGKG